MKFVVLFFLVTISWRNCFAQKSIIKSEVLSTKEITTFLTDSVKTAFNLNFPVFRIYRYSDKSGKYYCILTESRDSITAEKDTFSHKIKAVILKGADSNLAKIWEVNDHAFANDNEETSIWFWSKYIDFKDYDNDGLIDLIIIYGTLGTNSYDDGRIKFLIYYKGKKIAIRHQNGVLDFERETQVDKTFYDLPQNLQLAIRKKMEAMTKDNHAIFPYGWQDAMKKKKTFFSERK